MQGEGSERGEKMEETDKDYERKKEEFSEKELRWKYEGGK